MKQLNCYTAGLWGSPGGGPGARGPPATCCSAPVKHLSQETVFSGKRKCSLRARGELTYIDRGPCPIPNPHWSILMQMKTPNLQFDWSKKHSPDSSKWSHSDWSVKKMMGIQLCSSDRMGKPQSYWLKQDSRNSFIRAGSDGRNTVQAGKRFSAGFWSAVCTRGPCVAMAGRAWYFVLVCFSFEPN